MHIFKVMDRGSVFRIEFSYADRFRHNSDRIGSFSNTVISLSFSFPTIPFPFPCSYLNINIENNRGVFRPFPTVFILTCNQCRASGLLYISGGHRGMWSCQESNRSLELMGYRAQNITTTMKSSSYLPIYQRRCRPSRTVATRVE